MTNDPTLLDKLRNLLKWKKSRKFYAEKLNITEDEVAELIKEIRAGDSKSDEFYLELYFYQLFNLFIVSFIFF